MSGIISTGIPATLGVEGQTGVTSVFQVVGGYRFDFQPFDHAFIAVFHDLPIGWFLGAGFVYHKDSSLGACHTERFEVERVAVLVMGLTRYGCSAC